jgi:hypothetical protein
MEQIIFHNGGTSTLVPQLVELLQEIPVEATRTASTQENNKPIPQFWRNCRD